MKPLYLTFAFLLELSMLAALGYWGFRQHLFAGSNYLLGLGLPLLAAILWGIFAAPKSKRRLTHSPRLIFETILFLISVLLLYKTGQPKLALVFLVLVVIRQTVDAASKWLTQLH